MNPQKDNEIWASIKNGNKEAFELLYHRYVDSLYREASKRVPDAATAEDIVQDIFLSLWEKRETYEVHSNIYAYLYGMLIHRVFSYYRKEKLKPEFVDLWKETNERSAVFHEDSLAFTESRNEELEDLLGVTIHTLPNRLKQIYDLRYEQNLSVPLIAERLSTSKHTIYNQLKSIKKRLVTALKRSSYLFFFWLL